MNTITRHRGFTLIELMVVISIVVLVSIGVIPAARKLLQAQAGAQAASLFSAQLSAARAEAIMTGNYTGLHSQLSNRNDDTKDQCFLAVLSHQRLNDQNEALAMAPGHVPLPVPGNQAYGQLTSGFISSSFNNIPDGTSSSGTNLRTFTTLTVLFDRQGQVTPLMNVKIQNVWSFATPRVINVGSKGLFTGGNTTPSETALWKLYGANADPTTLPRWILGNMPGASGACVFDYKKLDLLPVSERGKYLDTHARILPINTYTGSLFDMKD